MNRREETDEYREEADRLAELPRGDQEAVVAMYRQLAGNPLATKACRADAQRKAEALANLLGLTGKRPARTTPNQGKKTF